MVYRVYPLKYKRDNTAHRIIIMVIWIRVFICSFTPIIWGWSSALWRSYECLGPGELTMKGKGKSVSTIPANTTNHEIRTCLVVCVVLPACTDEFAIWPWLPSIAMATKAINMIYKDRHSAYKGNERMSGETFYRRGCIPVHKESRSSR